jgi:SAM-dependent methyltransferase
MQKNNKSLHQGLIEKYNRNFNKYGFSTKSVGWSSGKTDERYFQLFKYLDNFTSVLDIGCGLGHLYLYLNSKFDIHYTGTEINSNFYNFCKESYVGSEFHLQSDLVPHLNQKFDVIVMSGLFNTSLKNETLPYQRLLDKAFILSNKYITFNFLSNDVDYKDDNLNYTPLGEVIEYCENRSKEIIIKKSSQLYEVTVTIKVKNE